MALRAEAARGRDLAVELAATKAASASLEASLGNSFSVAEASKGQLREATQHLEAAKQKAKAAEQKATEVEQQMERDGAAMAAQIKGLQQVGGR